MKSKQAEYSAKWYADNRKKQIQRVAELKARRQEAFQVYKRTLKCERCEENDPVCLDFHHLDPNEKDGDIGTLARSWSVDRLQKELDKCIVLCSNCHRKEHSRNR